MNNKKNINRYPNKWKNIFVKRGSKILSTRRIDFEKKYKADKIIKLLKSDFKLIKKNKKIMHFSIQNTGHKKGKYYLIVKIFKRGFYNGKIQKPPIIDLKNFFYSKCTYVKNNIPYSKITKKIFKNSLSNIKNVRDLKKAILRRYKKSLFHLSSSKKLSLGIGVTELKILKRISNSGIN